MSEAGTPNSSDFKRPINPEASPAGRDFQRGRGDFPRGKSAGNNRGGRDQRNAPVMSLTGWGRGAGNHHLDPNMSPGNSYPNRQYHGNQDDGQGNLNGDNFRTPSPVNRKRSRSRESHSRERHRSNSNNRDNDRHQGEGNRRRDRQDSKERGHSQERYRDRPHSQERNRNQSYTESPQNNFGHPYYEQNYNNSPHSGYNSSQSPQSSYGASPGRQYYDSSPQGGQFYYDDSPQWQQSNYNYSQPRGQRWRGSNPNSPEKRGRGRHGGRNSSYDFSSDGQTPDRNRHRWDDDSDVFLSKTLSSILRHNAEKFGFKLMKGGFLYVDDILRHVQKLHGFTVADIKRIVDSNDKKRFALETEGGRLKIRANQGHSIEVEDLDLTPILSADEVPMVIHGTYYSSWQLIEKTGLHRMNRNHIHFAAGVPGENGVISGMRKTCEVMIYIDLEKALKDGLKFYRSANNVILCKGDENGIIYPCYFSGVLDRLQGCRIDYDNTICSSTAEEKPSDSKKRKKKSKGKNKQEEVTEHKEEKTEQPKTKESEDGATTDDTSLPAAKKRNVSQSPTADKSNTDKSVTEKVETNRNENSELEADKVKSKDWQDPILVMDAADSKILVEGLCSKPPSHIAVCCVGQNLGHEDSRIRTIVITSHPNSYVYHLHDENNRMVKDGLLDQLLVNKQIHKVFHDIGAVSASFIREFDVLMDGTPIWDISMLFDKVTPATMDLEELNYSKGMFKKWTGHNEDYGKKMSKIDSFDPDIVGDLVERGKFMWDLYRLCARNLTESLVKKLKKEIFEAAIPSTDNFLADKIKALKLEKKGKKPAEKAEGASQQPDQQQQQQKQQQHQQQNQQQKQKQQHQQQQGKGKGKSGKRKK